MTQNVVIVGATSGIAQAVGRCYAARGSRLFLAARNPQRLEAVAADLRARGAGAVDIFIMDAEDAAQIQAMEQSAWAALGKVDVALIAYGSLPDQARAAVDSTYLVREWRVNAESVLLCLAGLAQRFQSQGGGIIAVVGSVAGDRGRPGNYLYGAAKSAVHAFSSGLRAQLWAQRVHVLTIKPGFVATSMTAHLNLPRLLTAEPAAVARRIVRAIDRRWDVCYVPGFWRLIMTVIRLLPETIFKRLKL
ncbi:MAG TPA: SDR family oxidoreductase [Steroidobacteraceae bacterium]|nr:SDR family oxidoreductase [Steroidobacteraceae bacterium]